MTAQQAPSPQEQRARFEHWCNTNPIARTTLAKDAGPVDLGRDANGFYFDERVWNMWDAWQAAIKDQPAPACAVPDWVAAFLNRRATVEQEMFNAARSPGATITATQVREWALRLGTPEAAPPPPVDEVGLDRFKKRVERNYEEFFGKPFPGWVNLR